MLLEVENLYAGYGKIEALHGISFHVEKGEIVTLIGANGAGKSTTLKAIMRLPPPESPTVLNGDIRFNGASILKTEPHHVVAHLRMDLVPEGRHIFGNLTVNENLKLATWTRKDDDIQKDMERVFELFPRLRERMHQRSDTLSGGEQQMLAVGRALMTRCSVLLLDEPSMGSRPCSCTTCSAPSKSSTARASPWWWWNRTAAWPAGGRPGLCAGHGFYCGFGYRRRTGRHAGNQGRLSGGVRTHTQSRSCKAAQDKARDGAGAQRVRRSRPPTVLPSALCCVCTALHTVVLTKGTRNAFCKRPGLRTGQHAIVMLTGRLQRCCTATVFFEGSCTAARFMAVVARQEETAGLGGEKAFSRPHPQSVRRWPPRCSHRPGRHRRRFPAPPASAGLRLAATA